MDKRSFPRYNILTINAYVTLGEDHHQQEKVWVKDLSLAGLQLYHTSKLEIEDHQSATFYLGQKFIRELKIKEVWSKESKAQGDSPSIQNETLFQKLDSITHLSGIELYFDQYDEFRNWRTLVQAIHKHNLKQD